MSKSRNFCFTINNHCLDDEEFLRTLPSTYLVYGREVGASGTPHLQGFVVFENPRSFAAVKKQLPKAHIEIAKGSPDQNREYCTKEGNFHEQGIIPMSQKRKGDANAERWSVAKKAAIEGRLEDVPDDIYVQYYRTLKEIKKDNMSKPEDLPELENYWICGPPGCGKSRGARERFPGAYFKLCNKWWDGYQGEETVIIDDWELDHKVLGHHLKIWGDRYSFLAETKGGAIHIRPKRIVITSNYCLENCFEDTMMAQAILRRFRVESFFEAPSKKVFSHP